MSFISLRLMAMLFGMTVRLSVASSFLERGALDSEASPQQRGLLQEIEGLFGQGSTSQRLLRLEAVFTPMFAALPKDDHGSLGPAAVRYALHRYFLQRHGWVVSGLEANGGLWNESSAIEIIRGRVPPYIENLFEERLGERGFGVHELAVFAAVFENLVRIETTGRIEAAYRALELSSDDPLSESDLQDVLETSLMLSIFDPNLEKADRIMRLRDRVHKVHSGWNDTILFLQDTRKSVAYAESSQSNPFVEQTFDLSYTLHVTEAIGDQYGHFQDFECQEITQTLLAYEYKGTGRIRLSDFYGLALTGDWRFQESMDYLRTLGALDLTDPQDPRVIVTNYMYGKNQCLASSKFYSVCCIDHCEALLSSIEDKFARPEASPLEIAAEVSNLPSATVSAPRNLSSGLLERLDEIAATHGGKIPIHSRSFSQFMHHAFPRECAFPHVAGTIKPMTQREWKASGKVIKASNEEIQFHGKIPVALSDEPVHAQRDIAHEDVQEATPWSYEEELVVMRRIAPTPPAAKPGLRVLFMGVAVAVVGLGLWQAAMNGKTSVAKALHGYDDSKVFV